MTSADPEKARFEEKLSEDLIRSSEVHINLGQDFIVTTEDRLHLCLKNYMDSLAARQRWITPVSLFATFMLVFSTSEFRDALAIKAATWEAFFLLCVVAAVIWSLVSITKAIRVRTTIADIITELKKSSKPHR